MITGFSAPLVRRSFLIFDFLVICLFTYFSCYIFRTFNLSRQNSPPHSFLFYCMPTSSSFFAISQLFSKLSSENSTKMFIKILKSISSYVYRCSLSLFISAFKGFIGLFGISKMHSQSPLSLPLFPFNSFIPEIDFVSKFSPPPHPVSSSIFALLCNLSLLIRPCPAKLLYSCFLQTDPLLLYI